MRNRCLALVMRDGKFLIEKLFYDNRFFYAIPGGGQEAGETPEEAAIRELREECCVDGEIVRKLSVRYKVNGTSEHVFLVKIPDDQEPVLGHDPEREGGEQAIKEVKWMALDELYERDRAFMFSYGIISIPEYKNLVISWGDELSYPGKDE